MHRVSAQLKPSKILLPYVFSKSLFYIGNVLWLHFAETTYHTGYVMFLKYYCKIIVPTIAIHVMHIYSKLCIILYYQDTLFVFELCASLIFSPHHHVVCIRSWPFWLNCTKSSIISIITISATYKVINFVINHLLHMEQVFCIKCPTVA